MSEIWRWIVEVWEDAKLMREYWRKVEKAHRETMKRLEHEYLLELCEARRHSRQDEVSK